MRKGWVILRNFQAFAAKHFPGGHERNGAAVKVYRDAQDQMGSHSDSKDGRLLHCDTPIVSLSTGATRKMLITFRPAEDCATQSHLAAGERRAVSLRHGDVFVFGGERFQRDYQHELPSARKSEDVAGGRASVVLRARKVGAEAGGAGASAAAGEGGTVTEGGKRKRSPAADGGRGKKRARKG